ncbi:ABC transporter ATP-binding protein [Nitriliruptor alkaliphilus]|uniref:ABC transporter ATP-binding protein n=1 Tax=Nitriliruptor alkaliphilus TaxID=427918 RepID=UPI0006986C55|nr:ATP-binding cassette domain-containing protein [Nitriliruptor alkaliphilus]
MTITVRDLVVTHDGRPLVDVPELHLQPGRPVTIVGESGSGKSLLAQAIMGTLTHDLHLQGQLAIDGGTQDLGDRRQRRRLWGRVLALLPQEPMLALDPTMRVRDQVAEGDRAFRRDRRGARRRAEAALDAVGLAGRGAAFPHTLSGGMAQRVAFAAATIGGAPVLLADEPSKGLDAKAIGALADLLHRHVEDDGILLTITHDLGLARELGGDVLVMKEATIVERGAADQVLTTPTHPYTRRLLAAEPRSWDHGWMGAAPADRGEAAELVTATGIGKRFGDTELFADLSLTVRAGERVAISGPSGSGKTTLGNVLARLLPPDTGEVRHAAALGGGRLQKLYQDPALAFPAQVSLGASMGDVVRRHRIDPRRTDALLEELHLPGSLLERRPGQVSGGELQRLAIIRAMLLEPAFLFADEPTSRLDLISQERTITALLEQVDAHGCALLIVTHDAGLAEAVAHRHLDLDDLDQATAFAGSGSP